MNMKHLYTSLGSGIASGSVTDNSITDDSAIEIYFDNTDCYIESTNQSGHTVNFTVGGNATGTNVCVVVNNLTDFTPYNDTDIRERVAQTEQDIINLESTVDELETTIDGLNATNINYDEHSTLYSAMGDIDELETTSKNLVGAINELKESGGGGVDNPFGTYAEFLEQRDDLPPGSAFDTISDDEWKTYSTTEKIIGTWIDGKPLYRKVIEGSELGSQNLNITVAHLDNVIIQKYDFALTNGNGKICANSTTQGNSVYYYTDISSGTDVVLHRGGQYWNEWATRTIVEYIKTTD